MFGFSLAGLASKVIAAAVFVSVAWLLISAYGDARYDAGWQAATDTQREAAEELKRQAADEKAKAERRLAALQSELSSTMDVLARTKEEALHRDETYRKWRSTPVHPVARCRIWSMCDPASGDSSLRAARSQSGSTR